MGGAIAGWKKKTILFLVSQSITLFGSSLVQMAIIWYVTLQTSSGVWVTAFTICSCLPQFLISFIGGVWADRFSRKMLIMLSDSIIAVSTLVMVFVMPYITDEVPLLIAILAVSVIRSLGAGVQTPAVNAVVPQLVPEQHLMRFNGINATIQSVVQFAAPAAAGAIMTFSSLRLTMLIDIATATVGIGLLSCIIIPATDLPKEKMSIFEDIKQGLSYAVSQKTIGRLLIIFGAFIFLCVPAGFLSTLYVSRVFGNEYWYMTAVEIIGCVGMAVGGVLMSTWGGFKKRSMTLLLGILLFGVLAVGMGISANFIVYLVLMLLYGVAITAVQTATTTMIQENAAQSVQGRMFGLLGSIYSGFLPVGMLVFGPLCDALPMQLIIAGSGVLLIVLSALLFFKKSFL